jgi:AraC-like DNA-binding protein
MHFPAVFRPLLGMAPQQWLEQALFARARRMLSDPRRTVRDVAYALEFSDEFNFSRFIKRRSGYSPTQLRAAPQGPVSNRK